jgi:iron complex transport system ATP-binding protein
MTAGLLLDTLSVRKSGSTILQEISATIAPAQILALVGPNGAGKSTLLSAIAGQTPFSGAVRWRGSPLSTGACGYMPQNLEVRAELSVLEVMLLGRHEAHGLRVKTDLVDQACTWLARLDLADLARRSMHTLSGGQQQLVLLAQRLMRAPDLLLLDEATSALDIRHQMEVLATLKTYVAETGALVMIAMHDLNMAAHHSDSILLLQNGRLLYHGPFDHVMTPDTVCSVYGVEAEFLLTRTGRTVVVPTRPSSHHFQETLS